MNFSFEISWAVATGNISPEAMAQLGNVFGNMMRLVFGGMVIFRSIICLVISIFMIICRWKVLEKAWMPGRGILIPGYNRYLIFQLGGRSGWNFLWILFPPVFIVLMIINYFRIAVRFGKPEIYWLGMILLNIVFLPILAFDDSKYKALKKKKK